MWLSNKNLWSTEKWRFSTIITWLIGDYWKCGVIDKSISLSYSAVLERNNFVYFFAFGIRNADTLIQWVCIKKLILATLG